METLFLPNDLDGTTTGGPAPSAAYLLFNLCRDVAMMSSRHAAEEAAAQEAAERSMPVLILTPVYICVRSR